MLKYANQKSFKAIYVVCGFTDMRYGIDSLAAIIETRYHLHCLYPELFSYSLGTKLTRSKVLSGKAVFRAGFLQSYI